MDSVVMTTRVRLARNLDGYVFPTKIESTKAEEIKTKIKDSIINSNSFIKDNFKYSNIKDLSQNELEELVEKHLISPNLQSRNEIGGVLIDKNEQISIMINEEDHIRIQAFAQGHDVEKAYDLANKIDDLIEEKLKYCFLEEMGYITTCPTNFGTGMRVSAMVHIPFLVKTKKIKTYSEIAAKSGLTIRGFYGEGSGEKGNIFQISNQQTLGKTEKQIIENYNKFLSTILNTEKELRKAVYKTNKNGIDNFIGRAYGIAKHARLIQKEEAIRLISDIKLGISLGLITGLTDKEVNNLIYEVRDYNLKDITESKDYQRAKVINEKLNKCNLEV